MRQLPALALLLLAGPLLAGCAAPGTTSYPLAVQLADISFAEAGLLEQSIGLDLRFTNPNPEPIAAEGMRFTLDLAGRRFGTGVSDAAITIPRLGEAVVPVVIRVQTGELINRLLAFEGDAIDYRIEGDLFPAGTFAGAPIAFAGDAAIALPDLSGLLERLPRDP